MLQSVLKLFFGSKYERDIKKMQPIAHRINALEPSIKDLSDEGLAAKTTEFKERIANGEDLDAILPEAFAVVRETAVRVLKMRHYDVQLMGGMVLHSGTIAEMKTGEGKTLTSTLAIYLNALTGKGVHIVTVNDYLAKRDAEWMSPIYKFHGLTVGSITSNMNHDLRREAYAADITYGTNNEFGFDYLRDNMVEHVSLKVQRSHYFAIIDEVDSILIDEARTPLIISGPSEQNTDSYVRTNKIIPDLRDKDDYEVDEKARNVLLTELGVAKVEKLLNVENLYDPSNVDLVHHVHQCLKAHSLFKKDVDYVVQNGEVIIVDEFTGRLMEGRRYSDGLHQALEAKEKVSVKEENQTLATITFQNYFRMYDKLAGMTGTADTEAEEFKKIYELDVTVLPTNKPLVREDNADKVYRTVTEKFEAIADEVAECNKQGQPVLLGTVSIENSERLVYLLKQRGVKNLAVLNAKYHEKEADIIKNAGQLGHVTIATNMAGRGTDIVLGDGVLEAGGLRIIGSERHESRRIDNQLRGRAGRQGDPGASRFYLSLEDDLMRIFGTDRIGPIMQRLGMEEGEAIEHKMVSKAIERAQKRVEGQNFDIRKHLLEYDDVMNRQRTYIYDMRNRVLEQEDVSELIQEFFYDVADNRFAMFMPGKNSNEWDIPGLRSWAESAFDFKISHDDDTIEAMGEKDLKPEILKAIFELYESRKKEFGEANLRVLERMVLMQVIDQKWKDHLFEIDHLKEGIWAMGYAERNPLVEFRFQAFGLFEDMVNAIKDEVIEFLFKAQVEGELVEEVPEYEFEGQALHDDVDGYGVANAVTAVQTQRQSALASSPNSYSKAAKKSGGGSSKRKPSRRKKR